MSRFEVPVKFAVLSLLWGMSFLLLLRVDDGFGWVGAVSIRSFIASGSLLLLALLTRRKLDFSAGVKPYAVLGATTVALQLIGYAIAVPRIGTALTAIMLATIPLFSSLIGRAMGIEGISRRGYSGLAIGFIGIVLLVGFPHGKFSAEFILGVLVSVIGSISAAYGSNYAKLRMSTVGNWEQVIGAFFFGGIFTLPLLIFVPFARALHFKDWLYIFLLAVLCSALCYVLFFGLVSTIGPTKAISVEFLVTVVAVLIGGIYLKESITPLQLLGGALVIVGCILILEIFSFNSFAKKVT